MTIIMVDFYFTPTTLTPVEIVNPKLGGYEFSLWLVYITSLTGTYHSFKQSQII